MNKTVLTWKYWPGTPCTETTVGVVSPADDDTNVLTVWPCSWPMSLLAADTCCNGSRFCNWAKVITWGCWWIWGGDGLAANGSRRAVGECWDTATLELVSNCWFCCWMCCRRAVDMPLETTLICCCWAGFAPCPCRCSWEDPILLQVAASSASGDTNDALDS